MARWMWRATVVTHRYLGVAVGLLMVMWFASGIVMMYVGYPGISPKERLAALPPLPWQACCTLPMMDDGETIGSAQIEAVAGTPVLRLRPAGFGPQHMFDLGARGGALKIDAALARTIAASLAPRVAGQAAMPVSVQIVKQDQWTIGGNFRRDQPLYRFALDDAAGTELYISGSSGEAVLWTTAHQRFWNWLGAVPHWLYLTILRSQPRLWTNVVIWTAVLGTFLTAIGLVLGIAQIRRRGSSISPYRGWFYWHHVLGLIFGIVTLTWVVSGLLSMNPWGLLESDGGDERAALTGKPPLWSEVRASLERLKTATMPPTVVSLSSAPFAGKLYWLAARQDGSILRLDAAGTPASVTAADLAQAAGLVAGTAAIASQGTITEGDAYYYHLHDDIVLPAYRVILNDGEHTRFYFDPASVALIGRLDANARWSRWLFSGLHDWDFTGWMRLRPLWDVIMLSLLLGGLSLTGSGAYLALRRIGRDIAFTRRR